MESSLSPQLPRSEDPSFGVTSPIERSDENFKAARSNTDIIRLPNTSNSSEPPAIFEDFSIGYFCLDRMHRFSNACIAALKSLSRSTTTFHRRLAAWLLGLVSATFTSRSDAPKTVDSDSESLSGQLLEVFAEQVEQSFKVISGSYLTRLAHLSTGLQAEFRTALKGDVTCMLPSYNRQLPTGEESGKLLAVDVGGSTLRVGLVELRGRSRVDFDADEERIEMLEVRIFKIDDSIKALIGVEFFNWMAQRIEETLTGHSAHLELSNPLLMGLSWSFPIEQTSLRGGLMQSMGKGFLAAQGLLGQDLADIIEDACHRKKLNIHLSAIVNDSTSTLLSKAYTHPTTNFGLILGTGVNHAVHLPLSLFPSTQSLPNPKLASRQRDWLSSTTHVIVNTELGMFGKTPGLLPLTIWDEQLDRQHILPGFQPFEHLVSGRYLGEVARLVIMDAVMQAGLFGECGGLPQGLDRGYAMDTAVLAGIEGSRTIPEARTIFITAHPCLIAPSDTDIAFLRLLAGVISKRSAALTAAATHALWQLQRDSDHEINNRPSANGNHTPTNPINTSTPTKIIVACNGSVIEKYPSYRSTCQNYLDALVEMSGGEAGELELRIANESSLKGAAVGAALAELEMGLAST